MTMMVPFQVIMIPLYMEEYLTGILNTYVGLVLPRIASAYGIYLLSSFFMGIPKSLEEAARIDGMTDINIYAQIIVPLSKPAFVSLGIYHFMNNWNDLLYPMMLTSSVEMRTLSAGLAILVGNHSIKYGPTLAATVISITPLLILFLSGQKFFHGRNCNNRSKGVKNGRNKKFLFMLLLRKVKLVPGFMALLLNTWGELCIQGFMNLKVFMLMKTVFARISWKK